MTRSFHSDGARNIFAPAGSDTQEDSWVRDIATGTGNVSLAATAKVGRTGRVLGIDISDKYLGRASRRAAQAGVQGAIRFSHQDVTHLELPKQYAKQRFDTVTCRSAITMFRDTKAVVHIIATDVLKPKGIFAVDMHGTYVPAKISWALRFREDLSLPSTPRS
jgi:ubiquinone/menaquinone biosynthesis C-methylase UbiE